jgi:isoquinoline 1-oxidoreductase beta subunit
MKQPVPDLESVALKKPGEFRIVGQRIARTDTPAKVDGSAVFGMDVKVPGMLYAVIARCPTFGGKAKRFDAAKAKAVPGVRHVVEIPAVVQGAFSAGGVAVVADTTWAAMQGRDALEIEWDHGAHAGENSQLLRQQFESLAQKPGQEIRTDGGAAAALERAAKKVEAVYEMPFLAHGRCPRRPRGNVGALASAGLGVRHGCRNQRRVTRPCGRSHDVHGRRVRAALSGRFRCRGRASLEGRR